MISITLPAQALSPAGIPPPNTTGLLLGLLYRQDISSRCSTQLYLQDSLKYLLMCYFLESTISNYMKDYSPFSIISIFLARVRRKVLSKCSMRAIKS